MSVLWIGHQTAAEAFPHTHVCGCDCEQGNECDETHDCPECRAKEAATYHFAPQVFPCLCCERNSTPENPVSYMPECQMFACADCQREFARIAEGFEAVCRWAPDSIAESAASNWCACTASPGQFAPRAVICAACARCTR